MRPLRFGVIGTSGHATRIAAPTLAASPDTVLLGAAGSRPTGGAEFGRRHRLARAYESIDALLGDPEVDAVWICSPNHLHAAHVARCAAAGKHVLVEKPLATSTRDADGAIEAARGAGITLAVGYQHRFRSAHQRLRDLVQDGGVGRVGVVRIHRFWRWPYYADMDPAGPPAWRRSPGDSGGWVTNDLGSHLIDLVLWLSGLPATLAGAVLATQRFAVETEDTAALLLALGDSAIGVVETSSANESPGSRIEIYGDAGWLRAEDTLTGAGKLVASTGAVEEFSALAAEAPYRAQVADFVQRVDGQPARGATGADGAAVVQLLEAAATGGVRTRRAS